MNIQKAYEDTINKTAVRKVFIGKLTKFCEIQKKLYTCVYLGVRQHLSEDKFPFILLFVKHFIYTPSCFSDI